MGGIAGLATAMLLEAGHQLVHVPGPTVNRARHGTRGGEHKSDPRDTRSSPTSCGFGKASGLRARSATAATNGLPRVCSRG
ncbi:hypothetical protein ACIBJI_32520 [Nocardia sp. NPDC050408]|uniref:hypothetical protein n=1 Tax=Nocardia sp. NPDC050408 TaxID=3364319 RepID=UPI003789E432